METFKRFVSIIFNTKFFGFIAFVYGWFAFIRDELLPLDTAEKLRLGGVFKMIDWYWWVIVGLIIWAGSVALESAKRQRGNFQKTKPASQTRKIVAGRVRDIHYHETPKGSDKNKENVIARPNIQLGDEISIRDVLMMWTISTEVTFPISCMASVSFANNPKVPNPYNDVAKARAEITYLDEDRKPLFKAITGRWEVLLHTDVSSIDNRILESIDFPNYGAVRWLDLILKYPEDEYCYAFNKISHAKPFFQHPEYQITKKRFFIQIRIKGSYIPDDVWELEVITKGKGDTFQIRRVGEEWQPRVESRATKNLPLTAKKNSSRKRTS